MSQKFWEHWVKGWLLQDILEGGATATATATTTTTTTT